MENSLLALSTFPLLAILPTLTVAAKAPRPNIIVILCDDLGYSDVGFNGATDIRTPSLDTLAKNGTICTSGYVTHPFCGPSRMGLMSGRCRHVHMSVMRLHAQDRQQVWSSYPPYRPRDAGGSNQH